MEIGEKFINIDLSGISHFLLRLGLSFISGNEVHQWENKNQLYSSHYEVDYRVVFYKGVQYSSEWKSSRQSHNYSWFQIGSYFLHSFWVKLGNIGKSNRNLPSTAKSYYKLTHYMEDVNCLIILFFDRNIIWKAKH